MALRFEWDPAKAGRKWRKHRVRFEEAATAFGDPLAITVPDPDHSTEEARALLLGATDRGRLAVVAFTERPSDIPGTPVIRLISARPADRGERIDYEEGEW